MNDLPDAEKLMKKILLAFFLLMTIFLPSCESKTTIEQYPLCEAKNPERNIGKSTSANFYYKNNNGYVVEQNINLNELEIKLNDKQAKGTILQITTIDNDLQIENKYSLLVTSKEELSAWRDWKRKWTEVELKPVYPPGYKLENLKPEKELK